MRYAKNKGGCYMKRIIPIILSFVILTACGSEAEAQKNETATINETIVSTEASTEVDFIDEGCNLPVFEYEFEEFENLDDFVEYASTAQLNGASTAARSTGNNGFVPLVPQYDTNKYSLDAIRHYDREYIYYFTNLETDKEIRMCIEFDLYYHTYEEMVEAANENLVVSVENIEKTIWGDTGALIQSVPFTEPVQYSLRAMIDENNMLYMNMADWTEEQYIECINDFRFT